MEPISDFLTHMPQKLGAFFSDAFGPEIGALFEGEKAWVGWGGIAAVIFIFILILKGRR